MKVPVLADTHIPRRAKQLPPRAYELLSDADVILHAGDVVEQPFLKHLEQYAPVFAVQGNNDHFNLPETREFELEGVKIAMIHDSGDRKGRGPRLRRKFPAAQVVVFGHSHIPINETYEGLLLFNPGSATDRRRQPSHTMGWISIDSGHFDAEIIVVD